MSKRQKLIEKFKTKPNDFTYDELVQLLKLFGYAEDKSGKTSGSAVRFIRENSFSQIRFHKPHPQKIIKRYILHYIQEILESEGLL